MKSPHNILTTHEQCLQSAQEMGGLPSDYLPIHSLLDASQKFIPDHRHWALTHNTFGLGLLDKHLGPAITRLSDGASVDVQRVGRAHIERELGLVLPVEYMLKALPIRRWMNGAEGSDRKRLQRLGEEIPPLQLQELDHILQSATRGIYPEEGYAALRQSVLAWMNGVDGPARHALRQPIIGDRSEEVSRLEAIVTDLLEDEPQDVVERITTKLRGYVHSEEIPG